MLSALLFLAAAAAEPAPLPAFLAGCWEERRKDGGWTEECWTAPRGALMIGSGRDGKGDTVGHWEWMRIERSADGALAFYASPKGAPAVRFNATESDCRFAHLHQRRERLSAARALHEDGRRCGRRDLAARRKQARPLELPPQRRSRRRTDQPTISSGLKK